MMMLMMIVMVTIDKQKSLFLFYSLKFDVDFYLSLKDKWSYGISGHPIYCHRAIRQLYELRERLNSTKDILSQAQGLYPAVRDVEI